MESMGKERGRTSPNSFIKAIAVEAILVIVVIVIVLGALNYFGVFSISKVIPPLGFLPQSSDVLQKIQDVPSLNQIKGGVGIEIEKEDEFKELIESWGVFNKKYNDNPLQGETNETPVRKITVGVSDVMFNTYRVYENTTLMTTTGLTITPGVFDLHVYVAQDLSSRSKEEIEKYIQESVVTALYSKGKNLDPEDEKVKEQIQGVISSIGDTQYIILK